MPLNSRNRGYESRLNHSVGEKMAVVHFTTMPCKPYSAHKVQRIESHIFAIVVPDNDTVYARLEDFKTFLYVFVSVV